MQFVRTQILEIVVCTQHQRVLGEVLRGLAGVGWTVDKIRVKSQKAVGSVFPFASVFFEECAGVFGKSSSRYQRLYEGSLHVI